MQFHSPGNLSRRRSICAASLSDPCTPGGQVGVSSSECAVSPASVVVRAIRLTMTSGLIQGLPRQFWLRKENRRCSILFHWLVPGGKWHTAIRNPVSADGLLPPPAWSANTTGWRSGRLPQFGHALSDHRTRHPSGLRHDRYSTTSHSNTCSSRHQPTGAFIERVSYRQEPLVDSGEVFPTSRIRRNISERKCYCVTTS